MMEKKNNPDKSVLDYFFDGVVEEKCVNFKPGFESFESFWQRQRASVVGGFLEFGKIVDEGLNLLMNSPLWDAQEKKAYGALLSNEKILEVVEKAAVPSEEEFYVLADYFGLDSNFYNKALDIGNQLLQEKKAEEAMKVYTALIQLNPMCYQFSQGLGYAFLDLGQNEAALGSFLNALEVVDDEMAYHITLLVINTLVLLGLNEQAKESLNLLIQEIEGNEAHAEELKLAKELLATL